MSHSEELGMPPNDGRRERNHPHTSPDMSAPPLVLKLTGTLPILTDSTPIIQPMNMPSPTSIRLDFVVGRST